MEKAWLDRVVRDLEALSGELLEKGLSGSISADKVPHQGVILRSTLRLVDELCALVPRLLNEMALDDGNAPSRDAALVKSPRGAKPSRRPADLLPWEGGLAPIKWLRGEQPQAPAANSGRWLLFLLDSLSERLEIGGARLQKQLEMAREARAGQSLYAMQDASVLEQVEMDVGVGRAQLARARQQCASLSPTFSRPSPTPPSPYPRSPAWTSLRSIARTLQSPGTDIGALWSAILSAPVAVADEPFLYQRWCGLQLVRSAQRQGWTVRGDLVGSLLFGGVVELSKDPGLISMWIEARVSRKTMNLLGWRPINAEITPDFLLVTHGTDGRDAFVLDSTLSMPEVAIERKAKYLQTMVGLDRKFVAGVPLARPPQRSWAITPSRAAICELGDLLGSKGAVPLAPDALLLEPLDAWLKDIFDHALRTASPVRFSTLHTT